MSSKAICIRETLYSAIRSVSAVSWLFARSPGRDFTRNVKLPFAKLVTLILSLKDSSIICELMEHFGCTKTLVSEPAFALISIWTLSFKAGVSMMSAARSAIWWTEPMPCTLP